MIEENEEKCSGHAYRKRTAILFSRLSGGPSVVTRSSPGVLRSLGFGCVRYFLVHISIFERKFDIVVGFVIGVQIKFACVPVKFVWNYSTVVFV